MTNIQSIIISAGITLFVAAVIVLVAYIGRVVKSHIAASALEFLSVTAGSLVAAAMEEVRNLKDPLKPGSWTPQEAGRIKAAVLAKLRSLGGYAIQQLQKMQGLTVESVETLLDSLIEEQVEALRQVNDMTPPTTINVSPSPSPAPSSAPVPDPAKS